MSEAAAEATTEVKPAEQQAQATTTAATETKAAEAKAATTETKAVEWDGKVETLPPAAQKIIADLRKEDGDERMAAKTLAAIQKALNPDAKGDEKPTAEALTTALAAKDETIRTLRVERALDKAAAAQDADADLLDAVLARKGSLKELDPSAKDFTSKLDALVKAELDANPKLKLVRAASASSANFSGGSAEGAVTQEQFNKMGVTERTSLFHSNPALYRQLAGR
jgi:hypothetical protein